MNDQKSHRVAVVVDGLGTVPRVAQPLRQLREKGVPDHEIRVIGVEVMTEALTERRHDLVHVCAAGPGGIAATLIARTLGLPVAAIYQPELHDSTLYLECDIVLSPGPGADATLALLGVDRGRIHRWRPGVDHTQFSPALYCSHAFPHPADDDGARFNVLYSGRLAVDDGVDLLADAFLAARQRDPRLQLILAGTGPEDGTLVRRLGGAVTFLGQLGGEQLAQTYASADLLVFPSRSDPFAQAILEAQASGLPVLAVDAPGPAELIEAGRSGCLVAPEPEQMAAAIRGLARRSALRERLTTGGLLASRRRTWEASLQQLADGWAHAFERPMALAEAARAA
jgi:glycosyltransferase involved in cell wall biosynthesis